MGLSEGRTEPGRSDATQVIFLAARALGCRRQADAPRMSVPILSGK
jgi:hypothetical protein